MTACGLRTEGPVFFLESGGAEGGWRGGGVVCCGRPVAPLPVYDLQSS